MKTLILILLLYTVPAFSQVSSESGWTSFNTLITLIMLFILFMTILTTNLIMKIIISLEKKLKLQKTKL